MANVLRVYGKKAAIATAIGDFFKAVFAVLAGRFIFHFLKIDLAFDAGYFIGLFVLIGHIYPVFFGFRGGKGVMPALGIIILVDPIAFLVLSIIAIPIFLKFKIISVVSIACSAILPLLTVAICLVKSQNPLYSAIFTIVFSILVIFSHRKNISRLINGTEKQTSPKKQ